MNEVMQPAPRRGLGCFGTGCATIVCLLVALVILFVGGGYLGWHYLQKKYSGSKPMTFANVISSESSVPTQPSSTDEPPETEAVPARPDEPRESVAAIQARWHAFEKAADRHEKARIELTASDINTLIDNDPKLHGKAFVSIQDNAARLQVSVPLGDVFMMQGRYLNGEAAVVPAADGDPRNAQISNIVLANQAVPNEVLDRRLFGWSSMRGYMTDWLEDNEIGYFSIQNNRVIGETRGGR